MTLSDRVSGLGGDAHLHRLLDAADRMARRMGGRFVVDPERMANLVAANTKKGPQMSMFSKDEIDAASAEVERLGRDLDITNADHIALWLEANFDDDMGLSTLAVRIVDAHERAIATRAPEPLLAEVRPSATLVDILGRPNFDCIAIARRLRKAGWDIPPRSENEQAEVIYFLLRHFALSGENYIDSANAELTRLDAARE